jgi:hypothetical protein
LAGEKNSELLGFYPQRFDVFITLDKNLRYHQNLDRLELKIFLLLALNNRRETLQALIEKVKLKIAAGNLQKLMEISCLQPPTANIVSFTLAVIANDFDTTIQN